MLLTIDSGNTNCVFAVFDGERCAGVWRSASDARRTADEHAVWLSHLMALKGVTPENISSAIVANVVPATMYTLKTLCRKYFNCDPLVVGDEGVQLGIKIAVDRPEEVGADRLVNSVAVKVAGQAPAIVIDFGTATTFDVVDANGDYLGGAIAPGINLSLEALHMAAAKLPRVEIRKPRQVIGKSTVPAIQSGVFWGYVGMIEGLVARIKKEYGKPMTVVATGGLAPLFADLTDTIQLIDPDLTLRGLVAIHRLNCRS